VLFLLPVNPVPVTLQRRCDFKLPYYYQPVKNNGSKMRL
jgi:hypothetical protein